MKYICSVLMIQLSLVFFPLGISAMSDAEWGQAKDEALNRKRLLIYDNDGDDVFYGGEGSEKSLEKFLALRTSYLAGSQIDTLIYAAMFGPFCNLFDKPEGGEALPFFVRPGSYLEWFYKQGTDPIRVELEFARQNNLEFFLSFRINDTHDAVSDHLLPPVKKEHPEWLCGRKDANPPYNDWSSFDFAVPQVREMFVSAVKRIVEKYEVDGISIDFHRQSNLFRSVSMGGIASAEERQALTEIFMRIRTITEETGRRRQRPILVLMRVPDSLEFCHDIGLDLEALLEKKLVDLIVPAGNWRLNPWSYSVALCRKYGVKCYASMDMPEYNEKTTRLIRNSNEAQWAWQAQALAAGCDGTYWFNRFYKGVVESIARPTMEELKLKSKRYHMTDRWLYYTPESHLRNGDSYINLPFIHPQHPMELASNQKYPLLLEFGDDTKALQEAGYSFEITALLQGRIPQPEKLEISSNGLLWRHAGLESGLHTYEVPANALTIGENTVTVNYKGVQGTASKEQIIMSGNTLLTGVHQPPWRRIFPECAGEDAEFIVDGAYRLADNGSGYTNLIYPLPEIKDKLILKATMKVESSSGGAGVACRIADGRHVETVVFTADKIACLLAGKSTPCDTASAFRDYQFEMGAETLVILADGKQLLEVPLTVPVGDLKGNLQGNSLHLTRSSTRSLLIGSLDNAGSGVSLWKNLRINRQNGFTYIEDFAVEVNIARPLERRTVTNWQIRKDDGKAVFFDGRVSWSPDPLVAEAEVDLSRAPVRLAFSRGGSFAVLDISQDAVAFPVGNHKPLKLGTLRGKQVFHVQFDNTERVQVFCGEGSDAVSCEFNDQNTTMGLKMQEFAELPELMRSILRIGGFTVLPGTDGTVNESAVLGLRARLFMEANAFPASKVQWKLDYEASSQDLPDSEWQSTYLPQNMEIVDGIDGKPALRLISTGNPSSQMISLSKPDAMTSWAGNKIAISCRMRYAGGLPQEMKDFFTIGGIAGNGSLFVQFGSENFAGNCGPIASSGLDSGQYFQFDAWFDKVTGEARFWINGELTGTRAAVPGQHPESSFVWGKTGANNGTVEISHLKIGELE